MTIALKQDFAKFFELFQCSLGHLL